MVQILAGGDQNAAVQNAQGLSSAEAKESSVRLEAGPVSGAAPAHGWIPKGLGRIFDRV